MRLSALRALGSPEAAKAVTMQLYSVNTLLVISTKAGYMLVYMRVPLVMWIWTAGLYAGIPHAPAQAWSERVRLRYKIKFPHQQSGEGDPGRPVGPCQRSDNERGCKFD